MSSEQFSAAGNRWTLFGQNSPGYSSATLGVNTNLSPNVNVGASTTFSHPGGLQTPTASATYTLPVSQSSNFSVQGSSGPGGHTGGVYFTHRF